MNLKESGLYFRKALIQRGFSDINDVVNEVRKQSSSRLKRMNYCRLVQELCDFGFLERKEARLLKASHIVRTDFSYLSPFAMDSHKEEGSKIAESFRAWVTSMGIDSSYVTVALLYEIGKLQESVMYCIKQGSCLEEGNFLSRLNELCSYLLYIKDRDSLRYKMVGFIFSGISEKRITCYTGVRDVQPYLKGVAREIGGVVQICEARENIGKCKLELPKKDLSSLGLSMPLLFRLGELGVASSEELYLFYKLGILENAWLLRPEWYSELLLKADFLR